VDGIFCLRGGYGAARLLPMLDYEGHRANPKVIWVTDIASCCSPSTKIGSRDVPRPIASRLPLYAGEIRSCVQPEAPVLPRARASTIAGRAGRLNRIRPCSPGSTERLLGNLSLVTNQPAHPAAGPGRAIVFLEDVSEPVYSIDRMLTQLWLSGNLQNAAGMVFGKFTEIPGSEYAQDRILEEVLAERARELHIPAAMGLMIGHVEDQTTVPLGCLAEFEAETGRLTLLETAVQ
jgi:muramoyltetrapeptide carboxypeptidase